MDENLIPFPGHGDGMSPDDAEKLLRGEGAAAAGPQAQAVGEVLDSLRSPGLPSELTGHAAATAAFTAHKEKDMVRPRRRGARRALTGAQLVAAAVVGSLALGGVAAAACNGSLPAPLQDVAHTLGAPGASADGVLPASDPTGSPTASPSGTPATHADDHHRGHGPSAFAVCWFVVHKTDGAAGGPWGDHANKSDGNGDRSEADDPSTSAGPTTGPTTAPTTSPSGDPSDKWEHGRGQWSAAYAKIAAAAAAKGQTVLQFCTDVLANHVGKPHPTAHPSHGKGHGDQGNQNGQGGRGTHDGQGHRHPGSGGSDQGSNTGGSGDGGSGGYGGGGSGDGGPGGPGSGH